MHLATQQYTKPVFNADVESSLAAWQSCMKGSETALLPLLQSVLLLTVGGVSTLQLHEACMAAPVPAPVSWLAQCSKAIVGAAEGQISGLLSREAANSFGIMALSGPQVGNQSVLVCLPCSPTAALHGHLAVQLNSAHIQM